MQAPPSEWNGNISLWKNLHTLAIYKLTFSLLASSQCRRFARLYTAYPIVTACTCVCVCATDRTAASRIAVALEWKKKNLYNRVIDASPGRLPVTIHARTLLLLHYLSTCAYRSRRKTIRTTVKSLSLPLRPPLSFSLSLFSLHWLKYHSRANWDPLLSPP